MTISSSSCGIWKINEVYNKVRANYWPQENVQDSFLAETYFAGCNVSGIDGSSCTANPIGFQARCSSPCWVKARLSTTHQSGAGGTVAQAYTARIRCDGTLWMNGNNTEGQLGDSSRIHRSSPVQVPGTQWCDVYIGNMATLALKTDGTLWAWGLNSAGELGQNNVTYRSSPVQIPGTQWCRAFIARTPQPVTNWGGALKCDGTLWVWGHNSSGQLAQGNMEYGYSSPVQVPGTQWVDADAAGVSSFKVSAFRKADGTVWIAGLCVTKLLCSAPWQSVSSPIQIPGSSWTDVCVTVGTESEPIGAALLLKSSDGNLYGLGCNLAACPLLACSSQYFASDPVVIPGSPYARYSASVGGGSVLAIKPDGSLWNWGLSISLDCNRSTPILVDNSPNWIDVTTSGLSSIAMKKVQTLNIRNDPNYNETTSSTDLYVFGSQTNGVLGLGVVPVEAGRVNYPERLSGSWCKIAFGNDFSISGSYAAAIKTDNTLWAWGHNSGGQLGLNDRAHRSSPTQIPGTQWCCVSVGGNCAMMALKTDGTLWTWGKNDSTTSGQLGLNNLTHQSSPTQIPGTQWCTINFACNGAAAIKTDGTLWGWGNNSDTRLVGDSTRIHRSSPVQIPGTQWCCVHTAKNTAAAIRTDGTLWVWGVGTTGSLGLNQGSAFASSPVQIPGTQWCRVKTGVTDNMLAMKCDNTLWVWGINNVGQLGQNCAGIAVSSPTQIPGTQWRNISATAGGFFATTGDAIFSWGCNCNGMLALVTSDNSVSSPTQIPGTNWFKMMDDSKAFTSAAFKLQKPL